MFKILLGENRDRSKHELEIEIKFTCSYKIKEEESTQEEMAA